MSKFNIMAIIIALITIQIAGCTPGTIQSEPGKYESPPPMTIDVNKNYTATIVTEKGDIVVELFTKDAPKTVNNFVFLAREGFYNGTTFHRVIPGFMAQGGDPKGTGAGGPGYTFEDEINQHSHATGVISMANSGANTNGSQFFITYSPQPHLDGKHTVFGKVLTGMNVLNRLTPTSKMQDPGFKGDPIIKITIEES